VPENFRAFEIGLGVDAPGTATEIDGIALTMRTSLKPGCLLSSQETHKVMRVLLTARREILGQVQARDARAGPVRLVVLATGDGDAQALTSGKSRKAHRSQDGIDPVHALRKSEAKHVIRPTEAGNVAIEPDRFAVAPDLAASGVRALDLRFFEHGTDVRAVGVVPNESAIVHEGQALAVRLVDAHPVAKSGFLRQVLPGFFGLKVVVFFGVNPTGGTKVTCYMHVTPCGRQKVGGKNRSHQTAEGRAARAARAARPEKPGTM